MRKIPTVFARDARHRHLVTPTVEPVCLWVIQGKGTPTQKFDGTACRVQDGKLYKRRELKEGAPEPEGFIIAGFANGKVQGWVPVNPNDPADQYHVEAWEQNPKIAPGTYELCGPMVNGNPENRARHELLRHGSIELPDIDRSFTAIKAFLAQRQIEGIVWHADSGRRMAKIKRRDFGLPWPPSSFGERTR